MKKILHSFKNLDIKEKIKNYQSIIFILFVIIVGFLAMFESIAYIGPVIFIVLFYVLSIIGQVEHINRKKEEERKEKEKELFDKILELEEVIKTIQEHINENNGDLQAKLLLKEKQKELENLKNERNNL